MKPVSRSAAGLLQPLSIPEIPWRSISLDFITGLPKTKGGYDAVLVVVDRLTKMTHFVATRKKLSTVGWARLFLDHVFKLPMVFLMKWYQIETLTSQVPGGLTSVD